jgi:hypothetical protein
MSKKTPKNSNRKRARKKEKSDKVIIVGIFIAFVAILIFLFYFTDLYNDEDAVAVVNGKEIKKSDLDWWYHTSVLPEYREVITKEDFLARSLIPQEVLVQEADKNNIKVTEEEIEKSLGIFIIDNGWTLEEFEAHLTSRGISLEQIKTSFEIRMLITKLFEKENLEFGSKEALFFDNTDVAVQDYLNQLLDNSEIEIITGNIKQLTLVAFEELRDDLCNEDKPIVRLYTTSKCSVCNNTGNTFKDLVSTYVAENKIKALHWNLDTGDNLLTDEKENGVPKEEVSLFKKYGNGKVPTTVVACKYKFLGALDTVQNEFNEILKKITGE